MMKIIKDIEEMRRFLAARRSEMKQLALVPTMGALHRGHLELIKKATSVCDFTICSIFVNPTQFNNQEDLLKYPRKVEEDIDLLTRAGCDVVFEPSVEQMYPEDQKTLSIDFGSLENVLEGKHRPGHFSGVGVVVSKLLNIIQPNVAFFGQKDLQQLAIIRKLVKDLNFNTDIVAVPTVRESSGLAMSSRNLRLSEENKFLASCLYQTMEEFKTLVLAGSSVQKSIVKVKNDLMAIAGLGLEYLEVINSDTMQRVSDLNSAKNVSICAAAFVDGVRIIDNIYIKQED